MSSDPTPSPPAPPLHTARATACVEHAGRKIFRGATASSALGEDDARRIARTLARERAEAAARSPAAAPLPRGDSYPYPRRVLVEPVLDRLLDPTADAPREIARITRNSYEASVLNAYDILFVDVDTASDTSNAPSETIVPQAEALQALAALVATRGDLTFRVYATRAGLRYLCTSRRFDPVSPESAEILRVLRADPRYALLCRVQKCYRARLSPKPWRCFAPAPAKGFFARLFHTPGAVTDPRKFATCRYLETVGPAANPTTDIARVIALHDEACEVFSDKPLA